MTRTLIALVGMFAIVACQSTTTTLPEAEAVRVRNCQGPARSLDPQLAAALPPRTGMMRPDDEWADLAATVPGGFAGILFDNGSPIIMLTKPHEAEQAKAALAGKLPERFPLSAALARQARWDFAQLVDWYNYLIPRVFQGGVLSGDKDEKANRIRYGVIADSTRQRIVRTLDALNIPCDLVLIEIGEPVQLR